MPMPLVRRLFYVNQDPEQPRPPGFGPETWRRFLNLDGLPHGNARIRALSAYVTRIEGLFGDETENVPALPGEEPEEDWIWNERFLYHVYRFEHELAHRIFDFEYDHVGVFLTDDQVNRLFFINRNLTVPRPCSQGPEIWVDRLGIRRLERGPLRIPPLIQEADQRVEDMLRGINQPIVIYRPLPLPLSLGNLQAVRMMMVEALRNNVNYDPFGLARFFESDEDSESERSSSRAVDEEVDPASFPTPTDVVASPEGSLTPTEIFLDGDWVPPHRKQKPGPAIPLRNIGDCVISPTEEFEVEQPSSSSGARAPEPKARAKRQWTEQEIEAEADALMDQILGPPLPGPAYVSQKGKGKGKGAKQDLPREVGRTREVLTYRVSLSKGKGKTGKAWRSRNANTLYEYEPEWLRMFSVRPKRSGTSGWMRSAGTGTRKWPS